MDDLIAWAKGQIQEAGNWYRWDEIAIGDGLASVVNSINWKSSQVQMLLWPNDVDILSIVDRLADKWHVLETKNGKVLLKNKILSQDMHGLKVKSSLSEDSTDESTSLQVWLDLCEDLILGVRWRADDDDVCIRHYILGLV
jgi:hypothetical protein